MKNVAVLVALGSAVLTVAGVSLYSSAQAEPPATVATAQQAEAQEHQQWLLTALTKAETIRPGMTRADVMPLFVSAPSPTAFGSRQPFALRDCPLIKVNISFLPAQYKDRKYWRLWDQHSLWKGHTEQNTDVVTGVDRPYLAR